MLSSANKVYLKKKSLHLRKSLMKIKKAKIPRSLWNFMAYFWFFSELKPLIKTYCFLWDKYEENQLYVTPLTQKYPLIHAIKCLFHSIRVMITQYNLDLSYSRLSMIACKVDDYVDARWIFPKSCTIDYA